MKKLLFIISAITMVVLSSCVSQAQYNQLKRKYETESLRHQYEMKQKEAGEKLCHKHFKSAFERSKTYSAKIDVLEKLLERELDKSIKKENQHQSDCLKDITDNTSEYFTFYAMDSASTATEALVRAHTKVQNSIKSKCDSIVFEAIDLYSNEKQVPFDTIKTDRLWNKISRDICHDVWKDSSNTYWAMEVQRIYWSEFVDTYIAKTLEEEASVEKALKEFEESDNIYYFKEIIDDLKKQTQRKLDVDHFKELLNAAITNKTILTEDAEKP